MQGLKNGGCGETTTIDPGVITVCVHFFFTIGPSTYFPLRGKKLTLQTVRNHASEEPS
jgi:hypothetical protein